ncbi:MAG TPA: hypothetical protein DEQ50_04675 [Lactobacillus sp.]|nr:hypothetical protein [Lactobacillus sp.]
MISFMLLSDLLLTPVYKWGKDKLMVKKIEQSQAQDKNIKIGSRERILEELMRMLSGDTINYKDAMERYHTSIKPIQVDFQIIRSTSQTYMPNYEMYYDHIRKAHGIKDNGMMKASQILTILMILAGTKIFSKKELIEIDGVLMKLASKKGKADIKKLMMSEMDKYRATTPVDDLSYRVGEFAMWILEKKVIEFTYNSGRNNDSQKTYVGVPYNIYFRESYFYTMIYLSDKKKTYLFRLDRFKKIEMTHKSLIVPAAKRKDTGEVLGKTQLLSMGNDIHFRILYLDYPQAALDKLPSSKIEKRLDDKSVIITGELFSEGAIRWILSQGNRVKVLQPQSLIDEVKNRLKSTLEFYE